MKVCTHNLRECPDAKLERRQFRTSVGVVVHCLQCMTCGRHTTHKVQRDASNPPELDRGMVQRAWEEQARKSEAEREAEKAAWRESYAAYLNTPEWAVLRAKVKQRDRICQGCLAAPVEEVHHLSYEHVTAEFAFELVGLCRKCHARLHGVEA